MLRAMNNSNDYLLIDTPSALASLCGRLQDAPWLAVDTEFLREKTYYPKLCVLQIATPQLIACIDAISINKLDPLLAVLYDTRITKVLHAARQDLEIFFHIRRALPNPVFDTQLAAPLLGLPEQMGYTALVEAFLDIHLAKTHTRTDWSQRPLSEAQLNYAADDVRYLARLYPLMIEKLEQLNRLSWLSDDFAVLTDPNQYDRPPEQAWLRVKGIQHVRGHRLSTLQALAAWRERTARNEDRPRNWLLRDENIVDLAKIQPPDRAALERIRGLNAPLVRKYGDDFLKVIEESKNREPLPLPAEFTLSRPNNEQGDIVELLLSAARVLGEQNAVNPALITNRKELERMVQGDLNVNVLRGWRRALAGETLLAVQRGQLCIKVVDNQVRLIETG